MASKPILVDLRHDTAVEPKDDNIPLEKKIVEGERLVDANNVSIGDRISYQVISEIPEYEANVDEKKLSYVFTDTFTHITFNNDLQVYIGESTEALSDSAYTLISDADSKSFTLSLSAEVIKENQGKTVKLTYSGTLTESALVDDPNGNPNRIELDYTNNPNQEDSKGHLEDEVITYTYGFRIRKVDKNDEYKDMAGAAFEVTDKDGKVIGSFEYGNDGSIVNNKGVITLEGNYAVIKGVDAGTYTITETKAPEGYSILGSGVEIEIADGDDTALPTGKAVVKVTTSNASLETKDESTKNVTELQDNGDGTIDVVVKIVNVRGISLPETGSAAMLMCMAGGAAAVLLGGLYFALTRRHRRID
ncbi:MAG: isopeptide-forming domain-containing fimbrial protein [Lachnospiraceae bacterium]|nr:isopeptide-forming domain-containing fimbrial protein [Lachnospiraceae bacterium]